MEGVVEWPVNYHGILRHNGSLQRGCYLPRLIVAGPTAPRSWHLNLCSWGLAEKPKKPKKQRAPALFGLWLQCSQQGPEFPQREAVQRGVSRPCPQSWPDRGLVVRAQGN